ncbi:MAG: DNA topoisomerase IV subunit A [Rhodospirillaceae bacterium]|nr:DNA topoisomerase IV subunit A [Rhodospirillaceae bacterium]
MADTPIAAEVRDTPLAEALGERYLSYALSTIVSRSLPDVRDGLKPVHRRLLHAMRELRLDPASGFKKCARIVGDVMGKYHPHGDQAIYDAMVRLAQEFAVRYPLVDGQGNFGNIDGDNPAAMRYTEARLTEVAELLLEGIDEDAVDFRETYDGEGSEPVVLPANFPNLLANGASGIAVGMATNIPPHNVAEICDALKLLLRRNPDNRHKVPVADLIEAMPGPDFPTGGVLVETREAVTAAYETGRGSLRIRARWLAEPRKGGGSTVVVTEIPYGVQKGRLMEKLDELLAAKKLPLVADIVDESAEDIRIVIQPRSRNVEPAVLMESLFRASELESRFGLNFNVLDAERTPRVMDLREALCAFLNHRREVLGRRTGHRLGIIARRVEVLQGFIVAYLNLDEVIRIVRFEDHPKQELMGRYDLNEVQVEAILNMRLRALHKLEEIGIREELAGLEDEQADLTGLLQDQARQWKCVAFEVDRLHERFGPDTELGRRRTELGDAPGAEIVDFEALVAKEPVTVLCSEKGWIRTVGGHVTDTGGHRYKEGDRERFVLHAMTTDRLVLFGTDGRFYTIPVDRLPRGRGFGEPIRLSIDLGNDSEIVSLRVHDPARRLLVASSDGRGFLVPEQEVVAQTKAGKQVLNVAGDVEAAVCADGAGDHVAVLGDNRKLLVFPVAELPEMTRGKGVILQKYRERGLADARTFTLADGLDCRTGARTRTFSADELAEWLGKRAQAGRLPPRGFPRGNRFWSRSRPGRNVRQS